MSLKIEFCSVAFLVDYLPPPLTIKKKLTHSDVGASNSSTLEVGNLFEATFCRFEPFRLVVGGSSTDGSFSIDY